MSDIERIIRYMQENGSITCKECEQRIGTTELRRRICDLKDKGYEIGYVWEEGENREGNKTRFKRYFIIKEPDCAARAKKGHCEPKEKHSFWDRFNRIKNLTGIKKQSTINNQQREEKNNDL